MWRSLRQSSERSTQMVEQLAIVNLEGSKTHVEAKAVIEGVAMLTGTSGERVERDPKAGTASTRDHLPRERIVKPWVLCEAYSAC